MMEFSCLTPGPGTNILKLETKKLHLRKRLLSFYGAKLTFEALYKVSKDVNVGLLSLDLNVRNVKAK